MLETGATETIKSHWLDVCHMMDKMTRENLIDSKETQDSVEPSIYLEWIKFVDFSRELTRIVMNFEPRGSLHWRCSQNI